MLKLLRADLLVLANTFRSKAGLVALASWIIVAGGIGIGSLVLCNRYLLDEQVIDFLREGGEPAFALLVGLSFVPALMLGFSLAIMQTRTELVSSPVVEQLLVAPLSRTSILGRTLVRALFTTGTFQLASGLAWIGPVSWKLGYSPLTHGAYVLAGFVLAAPLLALAILIQVLGLRYLSSPRRRLVLSVISGGITMGVSILWFVGLIAFGDDGTRVLGLLETRLALPAPISGAAAFVSAAGGLDGQPGDGKRILVTFACCLLVWPVLVLAARLLPSALDASKGSGRPIVGRGTVRSASWPTRPLPSILRKELAETLQLRSSIGAYLVITGLVFVPLKSNIYASALESVGIPETALHLGGLLTSWMILLFMIAPLLSIGIVMNTGKELSLLATSPVPRRALLLGKCVSLGLPLAWLWFVTPLIALFANATPLRAALLFLLVGLPILLLITALLAIIGTWPTLRRCATGGMAGEIVMTVVPAVVSGVGMGAIFFVVLNAKAACFAGRGPFRGGDPETTGWLLVAAEWGIGLVLSLLFLKVGERNLRVVLDPQP